MPQRELSQYARDAMLGYLARQAADVSDDNLTLLCKAAEYWALERAGPELELLRLVPDKAPQQPERKA